jgi:hypothetical protein
MKKLWVFCIACLLFTAAALAQSTKPKVILLISEQNIEGPQRAWWASEIDLSMTEAALAQKLIEQGYEVIDPAGVSGVIKQDKAFRVVDLSDEKSVKLAGSSGAGYLVVGKAIASTGGNVPQSNMRSVFANISAKLIRVKDGKVIAYLAAAGRSAHMDVISGGAEALTNASADLAVKILASIDKDSQAGAQ